MSTGAAALAIKGVTVQVRRAGGAETVDIKVPAGGVVAVIGPNGSGKSTLFNVITGLVEADSGSIQFHGEEIMRSAAARDPASAASRGRSRTSACSPT